MLWIPVTSYNCSLEESMWKMIVINVACVKKWKMTDTDSTLLWLTTYVKDFSHTCSIGYGSDSHIITKCIHFTCMVPGITYIDAKCILHTKWLFLVILVVLIKNYGQGTTTLCGISREIWTFFYSALILSYALYWEDFRKISFVKIESFWLELWWFNGCVCWDIEWSLRYGSLWLTMTACQTYTKVHTIQRMWNIKIRWMVSPLLLLGNFWLSFDYLLVIFLTKIVFAL